MIVQLTLVSLLAFATTAQDCKQFSEHWDQVKEIVSKMTLEQKIGQMTQGDIPQIADNHVIDPSKVQKYNLGSLLIGGNFVPGKDNVYYDGWLDLDSFPNATASNWLTLGSNIFLPTEIKDENGDVLYELYPLLGTDAVHGNQHVIGTPLFPHNIGLAATHNPKCFQDAGYFMARDVLATGFNFAFAPTVAVSHNFQWGRHYETMGAEPEWTKKYAAAFVKGAQAYDASTNQYKGVLSSTKHFLGDGATWWGVDEGNATVHNFRTFLERNYAGYQGAIEECTGNIMCSYSAINRLPMASNTELLEGVLKDGIYDGKPFYGFVISDYDEIGKLAGQGWPTSNIKMTKEEALALEINAGMDMVMLASTNWDVDIDWFQSTMKDLIAVGAIDMDRIDNAVMRILGVKAAYGLIKKGKSEMINEDFTAQRVAHMDSNNPSEFENSWEAALNAAQQSLVLLKNEKQLLPLEASKVKYVVFIGERTIAQVYDGASSRIDTVYQDFNNIGAQNGGWSLRWQGFEGNMYWEGDFKAQSHASSLLDAVSTRVGSDGVLHPTYNDPTDMDEVKQKRADFIKQLQSLSGEMTAENTVVIGVLAQSPYAEFMGDINNPMCLGGPGCLYWAHANAYTPDIQKTTLEIGYDDYSKQVLTTIGADIPVVTFLISGRPMVVNDAMSSSEAFVAAWLPGTSGGEAMGSALFGDYLFRGGDETSKANTLPVQWVKDMASLENYPDYFEDGTTPSIKDALFEIGYGLVTKTKSPALASE